MAKFHGSNVKIKFEVSQFIIKTADSERELLDVLKLRHQIFYSENPERSSHGTFDRDEFDNLCDHLIVIHKPTQTIVGCYRLNCSIFNSIFEVQQEFPISELIQGGAIKLELSYAFVKPEFRSGFVINLLWRGLTEYFQRTNAEIIFGVTSFYGFSLDKLVDAYLFFQKSGLLSDQFQVRPHLSNAVRDFDSLLEQKQKGGEGLSPSFTLKDLPPLCRAYLRAGARIGGLPSFDADLNCHNFLTILNKENLEQITKKFAIRKPSPESQASPF